MYDNHPSPQMLWATIMIIGDNAHSALVLSIVRRGLMDARQASTRGCTPMSDV
jgi:hypothetical protein